jgi:hypothetical protein
MGDVGAARSQFFYKKKTLPTLEMAAKVLFFIVLMGRFVFLSNSSKHKDYRCLNLSTNRLCSPHPSPPLPSQTTLTLYSHLEDRISVSLSAPRATNTNPI